MLSRILLLSCALLRARADIPAHCLQSDVLGKWTFSLSAPGAAPETLRAKCAREVTATPFSSVDVELHAPSLATTTDAATGKTVKGFWTMVFAAPARGR